MSDSRPGDAMENSPFSFKEILYRILALLFLVAVIGAVLLIAEDTNAATELRECADAISCAIYL